MEISLILQSSFNVFAATFYEINETRAFLTSENWLSDAKTWSKITENQIWIT